MNNGGNTFTFNEDARYAPYKVTGLVARVRPGTPDNDYAQPGTLFRKVMCDQAKKNTIFNFVSAMKGVRQDIAERVAKMLYKADGELGDKVAQGLGFPAVSSRL
jgi:catalase